MSVTFDLPGPVDLGFADPGHGRALAKAVAAHHARMVNPSPAEIARRERDLQAAFLAARIAAFHAERGTDSDDEQED